MQRKAALKEKGKMPESQRVGDMAQEYVALKANRERITRQEAIEKLLEQRENKSTLLVDNLIMKDEG